MADSRIRKRAWPARQIALALALIAWSGASAPPAGASSPASATGPAPIARSAAFPVTPPMGWSSWYHFGCGISEPLIERTAAAMTTDGLRTAGYRYVDIDDCWMSHQRLPNGGLSPDPRKFPDGISGVARAVHREGLKLGLYLDTGPTTCTGFPGSAGHEAHDSSTIAGWGVDALKLDYCRTRPAAAEPIYRRWRRDLDATGRQIMLQICEWGYESPWTWGASIGDSWRTTGDYPSYGAPRSYWEAILKVLDLNAPLAPYARPGAFNDPNGMLIGTGVLTTSEERAQMSLWSMLAAPLIAAGDISSVSKATLGVLENRRVIAVDQDPAVLQGTRIVDDAQHQVWLRRLANGSRVLLFLNPTRTSGRESFDLASISEPAAASYSLTDLWSDQTFSVHSRFSVFVAAHDVRMLLLPRSAQPSGGPSSASPPTGA